MDFSTRIKFKAQEEALMPSMRFDRKFTMLVATTDAQFNFLYCVDYGRIRLLSQDQHSICCNSPLVEKDICAACKALATHHYTYDKKLRGRALEQGFEPWLQDFCTPLKALVLSKLLQDRCFSIADAFFETKDSSGQAFIAEGFLHSLEGALHP